MRIDAVSLVVADVDLSADFYEHVLELPVSRDAGRARITVGASILDIQGDPAHTAPHHLAITIPSNKFDTAKEWIRERVELLSGQLDVSAPARGGTAIRALLPLDPPAQAV